MATKICSKCKEELDIGCFDKNKSKKDGFSLDIANLLCSLTGVYFGTS